MKKRTYNVQYYEHEGAQVKEEQVDAFSSVEAYSKFMDNHGWTIYSVWVDSYNLKSGNRHYFNNFSGKAY